jgi:hypothetical protein
VSLFDECGFEVYETMGRVPVDIEENPVAVNMMTRSVLQLRGWEEHLRQQLYTVHGMAKEDHMTEDA